MYAYKYENKKALKVKKLDKRKYAIVMFTFGIVYFIVSVFPDILTVNHFYYFFGLTFHLSLLFSFKFFPLFFFNLLLDFQSNSKRSEKYRIFFNAYNS